MFKGHRKVASARTRKREQDRFSSDILSCPLGDVVDLSGSGIRLRCKGRGKFAIGVTVPLKLSVPEGHLTLPARVVRIERCGFRTYDVGLQFAGVTPATIRALKCLAQFGFVTAVGGTSSTYTPPTSRVTSAADARVARAREVLNVTEDATLAEIQRAYHKLALTCHPDANHGPDGERRFAEIVDAHRTLRDAMKAATAKV